MTNAFIVKPLAWNVIGVPAGGTAAGTSENYLGNDYIGTVWRTTATSAHAALDVDFGAAVGVDFVALLSSNGACTNQQVYGATVQGNLESTGYLGTATTFAAGATTPSSGRINSFSDLGSVQSYRWWRIYQRTLTAAFDAGRLVIGRKFQPARNFTFGALSLSVAYALFFGNVVLLPLWLQQWMGYTATNAGLALAPVGILAILLTPLIGKKVTVWDPRRIATIAFLGFAVVLWMRSQFTVQTDLAHILIPTVLQGAAMAMFFIPLTTLTLAGIPPERIPSAAGLSNFTRITAGAMGTSIATTVWESRAAMHHAHMTETLVQGQGVFGVTLESLKSSGLSTEQALAQINRLIDQQAFTRAADDVLLASAYIFVGLISVIWLTKRPAQLGPTSAAADAGGAH